ncbi:MAG TPA: hypothetical protein VGO02_12945 [Burkholderiales bacterium]|nr:hypothetical protein [Burkholderiales bacterium]
MAMLLLGALGACAPPPSYTSMVPELALAELGPGPAPSYRGAITVAPVSISTDTSTPWTSQVGSADFQEALLRTLTFANLANQQNGRFRLDAVLLRLERPYAGFAMTVTASVAYRLTEIATGAVVYQETRTSLGSASLNDAVTNTNRLRIADERALRANIRKLVEDLYALPERASPISSRRT